MNTLTPEHHHLIGYIHACILSAHSRINPACLHCIPERHPEIYARFRGLPRGASGKDTGPIDDWDRLADLVTAGIIPTMPGSAEPSGGMIVRFTAYGQQVAERLVAQSPQRNRA